MSITVEVNDIGDITHWENAFRVLGLTRCQALLLDAGVPSKMVSAPDGLTRAAHYFWQIRWQGITWEGIQVGQGYSDPGFPENYRLGILALLNNTFNMLVNDYGEADASELDEWARRHFINQKQSSCLFIWYLLFLAAVESSEPVPFPDKAKLAEIAVRENLGADRETGDANLIALARNIPLSPVEQRMVALEVTSPTDLVEVDLLDLIEMVLKNQRTYQVWIEIDKLADASEREALLWWGYERAAVLQIPAEEVVLPERTFNYG